MLCHGDYITSVYLNSQYRPQVETIIACVCMGPVSWEVLPIIFKQFDKDSKMFPRCMIRAAISRWQSGIMTGNYD